jgi:phosphate/sulfate permease
LKILFWVLPFAALALAAALLYLQDRYRDYRKTSKSDREIAEKKGMIVWQILFLCILLCGSISMALSAQDLLQRIGWLVLTAGLAWQAVVNWRAYSRLTH